MSGIAASQLQTLAALMVEKRLDRKRKTPWADRRKRPFLYWLQGMKKRTGISGSIVSKTLKFAAGGSLSTWSGDVTLPSPGKINNHAVIDFEYANFFYAWEILHDDYRKLGYTILPNGMAQTPRGRVKQMSEVELEQLKQKLEEDIDSADDDWERLLDLAVHKQGTASTDLVGLNGLFPINLAGSFGGFDREREPLVQHVVYAGSATRAAAGNHRVDTSGTTGSGGTLKRRLETILRELGANAAGSGLKGGRFVIFAGSGAIDKLKDEYERLGITTNREAASPGKVDLLIMDEDLVIGRHPVIWDPTIDDMDNVAASEKGVGMSSDAVSFSGGAGSGAKAVAVVGTGGAITDIVVTERGSGYTSAPTVSVANGSGATFQAYVYSASSGAGLVQVDADDNRIGQLAYVEVTAGGTGYTTGGELDFTDRFYVLYEPSWEFLYQDGLDRHMSVPADQPRRRATEFQNDATYFLTNCHPRVNGIVHAA